MLPPTSTFTFPLYFFLAHPFHPLLPSKFSNKPVPFKPGESVSLGKTSEEQEISPQSFHLPLPLHLGSIPLVFELELNQETQ